MYDPFLGPGHPGCLSLSGHRPLELLWYSDILHLDPLHSDAPGLSDDIQSGLTSADITHKLIIMFTYTRISVAMDSRWERISPRFIVPKTFLRLLAARRRVEPS